MRNILEVDSRIRVHKIRDFIDEPVIIYVNEFDDDAVRDFEEDMDRAHETTQEVIPIVIESYGGSCYGENAMVSSVLNAKKPVATIVKGRAMSAGACLFGYGTEGYRFMDPFATLMIHDAAAGVGGKVEDVKASAKQLEHLNIVTYKRLSKHLGHDEDYLLKEISKKKHVDWYLTAKEAKKHNLANHLYVPEFRTKITVETTFGK